jgi:anti-sigma B factor antagonist
MSDEKRVEDGALAIEFERDGDTVMVSLRGEVDLATATLLQDQLKEALGCGADRVIVDLSALSFIDSTGMRVLLEAALGSQEDSTGLYFLRGSTQVERILLVSGVKQRLRFLD